MRALLVDRDGTLCDEVGYVNHVDRLRLLDRSALAIRLAREAGFCTVLITNQAGVARGYFDESLIGKIHSRLVELLAAEGSALDGIYYCPPHPEVGSERYRRDCGCRKPKPGMLLRARDELGIDLEASYMIGEQLKDLEAGAAVGARPILVLTGYGRGEFEYHSHRWRLKPHFVAEDLLDAVEWILRAERANATAAEGSRR